MIVDHVSRHQWPGRKTGQAMTPQDADLKPARREEIVGAEAQIISGQKSLDDGALGAKHEKPRCRRRDVPRKTQARRLRR